MVSENLTNPDNPSIEHGGSPTWNYKEAVMRALEALGVPKGTTDTAVVDYRTELYTCQRNKLTPEQTADMMYEILEQTYHTEEGWKFAWTKS